MTAVPESIKRQIANPQPDIKQFLAVIQGKAKPTRALLAELFADQEIMAWVFENVLGKPWVPASQNPDQMRKHLLCEIEYWYRMGYDYVRVSGGLDFPTKGRASANTAELAKNDRGWTESHGVIQNWADFEGYAWPQIKDENLWMYHFVAEHLPEGMGLMLCPTSGFLEVPCNTLVGYESLATMIYDEPELVRAVFDRVRELIVGTYQRLVGIPRVVGFFQGDDMGFLSGTLFSPEFLKSHSLPGHRALVELAHAHGKVYMMHACGNLSTIMDYLIDQIGIDAKHSFEDKIMPVEEVYRQYGTRVALLGGLDLNFLARGDEQAVRRRTREILNACMPGGRYALGSGNTIANYCIPQNVLAMFDEAYRWGR